MEALQTRLFRLRFASSMISIDAKRILRTCSTAPHKRSKLLEPSDQLAHVVVHHECTDFSHYRMSIASASIAHSCGWGRICGFTTAIPFGSIAFTSA